MSPLTWVYLGFSQVAGPIWRHAHRKRLQKGKEDPARVGEKYGRYTRERPVGTMIWLHALSVGESLALIPLIEHALRERPDAHVLLTTSTLTSLRALENAGLPERCIHVFQPIDTVDAVGRFLDHWRPDFAGFAELDFWPRLMIDTARRGIPLVLINSRMQSANFERRSKIRGVTRDVVQLFDRLLVQNQASADRFARLGADPDRIEVAGALKAVARPLLCDEAERARLATEIGARSVWLVSSSFETEQAAMIEAQVAILQDAPEMLMIWAPRHLRDADAGEALAKAAGLAVSRRSRAEGIMAETQVYLADTIGEMGLWYRLAPVSFMGHSLFDDLEGKNPFEAAALGSAILHGPNVAYFAESYAGLADEGAARVVADAAELSRAVLDLRDPAARAPMLHGAARAVEARRDVLNRTWEAIAARL